MQRCCFLSDYYSVLGCNFPKSYFVLITGSKSEPMRVGSVGIVLVFMPCEFDSTITATPLSKCISPETERLNVILEYSRGKTEFINIFWRNTHGHIYTAVFWISSWLCVQVTTCHFTILKMTLDEINSQSSSSRESSRGLIYFQCMFVMETQ